MYSLSMRLLKKILILDRKLSGFEVSYKLVFFSHFSFKRNRRQTAVINMTHDLSMV